MLYKACIFDLDGTLTNTINSIAYFGNKALIKYGLKEIGTERYKILIGDGAKVLVRRMLEENNCYDEETYINVYQYYTKTYDDDFLYKTSVYNGIKELLGALKEKGLKTAVLSNKPHSTTVKVVDAMFGEGYFDACYGSREGVPLKPNPAPLLNLIEELGVNSSECLYVGDTATDMQTGKNGGLFTIGVLWGFRGREELESNNADLIVSKPCEILEHINKSI